MTDFPTPDHPGPGASTICLVTRSDALRTGLAREAAPLFRVEAVTPEALVETDEHGRERLLGGAAAVVVDWDDGMLILVPILRATAARLHVPLFTLCGPSTALHVAALVVGADGVLEPPFRPALLQARLMAYRRLVRPGGPPAPDGRTGAEEHDVARAGPLVLDRTARSCSVRGQPVHLTPKEFELLALLLEHPGVCLPREVLLGRALGWAFDPRTNVLDVHVYKVRRRLRPFRLEGIIETVRGVGFRLVPPPG